MKHLYLIAVTMVVALVTQAQTGKPVTRIATLTIDSSRVKDYMRLLKEQMETAVRVERGVISYQVYANKTHPHKLTIVEVYADQKAYLAHREAAHFVKYKTATANMVQSLELAEVDPVLTAGKN